jgi:hypothetical protein
MKQNIKSKKYNYLDCSWKFILLQVFIFFAYNSSTCYCQQDKGKKYISTYQIGKIPDDENFMTLNIEEKQSDSLYNNFEKVLDSIYKGNPKSTLLDVSVKKDYINNRSRIYMNSYTNSIIEPMDSDFTLIIPTPCDCYIIHDSLFIRMGAGFFGGFRFNIEMSGKNFQSSFYNYIDDVKPYKLNLNDTTLNNYITVKSKYQSLILNHKPTFKVGQQITGYFRFTSTNYFELNANKTFDSTYVDGKIYFTCKTRKIRDLDKFNR